MVTKQNKKMPQSINYEIHLQQMLHRVGKENYEAYLFPLKTGFPSIISWSGQIWSIEMCIVGLKNSTSCKVI